MILKIGSKLVNLDNVTYVKDAKDVEDNPVLKVYFNVTQGESINFGADYIQLRGHEANALRQYLESMAVDVMAVYMIEMTPITQE